jgi:hypothetical protein
MAFDDKHDQSLDETSCLVVAALADGEPVDPDALRAALDDPAVREYLVDLIALRRSVGTMSELSPVQWRERRSFRSRVGWMAAAAALAMSLTAGYVTGQRAGVAAPTVETFIDLGASSPAPKPTRIVPLRPGVNWTEQAGER